MDASTGRRSPERLVGFFVVLALCACGGGGGGTPGGDELVDLVSEEVGVDGAIIELEHPDAAAYGLRIDLPSGAFPQTTSVIVRRGGVSSGAALSTWRGPSLELTPAGLAIDGGALLTLTAPDQDGDGLVDGTTIATAHLGVFAWSVADGVWTEAETTSVGDGAVTAFVGALSTFALGVREDRLSVGMLLGCTARALEVSCGSEPSGQTTPTLVSGPSGMQIDESGIHWPSPIAGDHVIEIAHGAGATETHRLKILAADAFTRLLPAESVTVGGVGPRSIADVAWEYCPQLRFSKPDRTEHQDCLEWHRSPICGEGASVRYWDYWPISVEVALGLSTPGFPTVLRSALGSELKDSPDTSDLHSGRAASSYIDFLGQGRPRLTGGSDKSVNSRVEAPFLGALPPATMYWTAGRRPDGALFIQYWFFYIHNQWLNSHEGDWETCTVFFDAAGQPLHLATSVHFEGLKRCWADVDLAMGVNGPSNHPELFVANGAHATYMGAGTTRFCTPVGYRADDEHAGNAHSVSPDDLLAPGEDLSDLEVPLAAGGLQAVPIDPISRLATGWAAFPGYWGWGPLLSRKSARGPRGPAFRLSSSIWCAPWRWASGTYDWPNPSIVSLACQESRLRVEFDGVTAGYTLRALEEAQSSQQGYIHDMVAHPTGGFVAGALFRGDITFVRDSGETLSLGLGGTTPDGWLGRFDQHGRAVWAYPIAGGSTDKVVGVDVDAVGNCYAAGRVSNNVTFSHAGGATASSGISADCFVTSYAPDGTMRWLMRSTGGNPDTQGLAVATDPTGNPTTPFAYVCGFYEGTLTMPGPGAAVRSVTSTAFKDGFLARTNDQEEADWLVTLPSSNSAVFVYSVVAMPDGGCVLSGRCDGTVVFGQGQANEETKPSAGMFVARYQSDSTYVWSWTSRGLGGGLDLAISPEGELRLLLRFWESQNIGHIGDRHTLDAEGGQDTAVVGMDADGMINWVATVTGADGQDPRRICVDADGNSVVCLYNSLAYTIEDGAETVSVGSTPAPFGGLALVLDPEGELVAGLPFSASEGILPSAVCPRSGGGFHLGGYYRGEAQLRTCGPVDGRMSTSAAKPQVFFAAFKQDPPSGP